MSIIAKKWLALRDSMPQCRSQAPGLPAYESLTVPFINPELSKHQHASSHPIFCAHARGMWLPGPMLVLPWTRLTLSA